MNNALSKACKPARLWCLTGRKHNAYLLKERVEALSPRPLDVRTRFDARQLIAIVLTSAYAIGYSFGLFSPQVKLTDIIRPPGACDPPPKERCKRPAIPPPCPPEKYPPEPPKPCE